MSANKCDLLRDHVKDDKDFTRVSQPLFAVTDFTKTGIVHHDEFTADRRPREDAQIMSGEFEENVTFYCSPDKIEYTARNMFSDYYVPEDEHKLSKAVRIGEEIEEFGFDVAVQDMDDEVFSHYFELSGSVQKSFSEDVPIGKIVQDAKADLNAMYDILDKEFFK